ncbi:DNA replication/repair protein RecF [Methylocystis heyeri]|uniref:DNA replication and repair protein RecF n=1 Tax=Methylocystis heyeri TaxID=391905 RepID=A0A6B8KL35_9HYPH|nr:DNA replication/repair protein RecF [Methylocystis heyeri]QGM47871.1 DNA replication/repair protein RecF [Methylocystis heyeri]
MSLQDANQALVRPLISRLTLRDFRSYVALDIRPSARLVALTGENGAGKTNILEAISMFSPGRGLRRAEIGQCARRAGPGGFAVSIEADIRGDGVQLGHGYEPAGQDAATRRFRIDRAPVSSARAFADYVNVLWQTPAMDGLFSGPAGERRRFLDRLTLGADADHGARVARLERALRNRNRLLEDQGDSRWLSAAEQEIASLGVAVASARLDTTERLSALIEAGRNDASPFPHAVIRLEGDLERMLVEEPAFTVEERYRATLAESRRRDAAAGRTLIGPQTSDLVVFHGPKGVAAQDCSTGEQKALLTGLVLAHARLVAAMSGRSPLLLLDEAAAHFDSRRREALYEELENFGGQVWMTGADPELFASLSDRADIFTVAPGTVERR